MAMRSLSRGPLGTSDGELSMAIMSPKGNITRIGLAIVCAGLLAACATPPSDPAARASFEEANDPLEPMNRAIFDVNMAVDKAILKPVAIGYRDVVHSDIRNSIRNFLNNVASPVIFINDVLQGEASRASDTAVRFFVNSTAGMLGLFDVAAEYGLERHSEDFGQTLAVWGFDDGPYIMLPLYGPSNVRDTVGKVAQSFMNPFTYWARNNDLTLAKLGTSIVDGIDRRSRHIDDLDDIEKNALDFYATLRSLYRQNRRSEILNGDVTDIPVPEIDDEDDDD
jgi:phospholipid-binding lipoprotein MlaA